MLECLFQPKKHRDSSKNIAHLGTNVLFLCELLGKLSQDSRKALNEVRRYARFICPKGTLSAWQGGGKKLVSFVENLSLGGVCLRTSSVLSPGNTLQLLLDLPGGQVRARAIVQWSKEKKGMGARFIAMQQEDRGRLSRWLNTQKH